MGYRAGFLVYMLLGAFFRRLLKVSKDLYPSKEKLHIGIRGLMAFSDFCDPLVIWLVWDWLDQLSLGHQLFYYALATVRVIMNAKSYETPKIWYRRIFKGERVFA